jgi:hypothetical protein
VRDLRERLAKRLYEIHFTHEWEDLLPGGIERAIWLEIAQAAIEMCEGEACGTIERWHRGFRLVDGKIVEVLEAAISKPEYEDLRRYKDHHAKIHPYCGSSCPDQVSHVDLLP